MNNHVVYTADFYDKYNDYLNEPVVRNNHDKIFKLFNKITSDIDNKYILDLGCGLCEFSQWGTDNIENYIAVDLEAEKISEKQKKYIPKGAIRKVYKCDYTDIENLRDIVDETKTQPNIFVSLFSAEAYMPINKKYDYYKNLFEVFPTLKYGLVSGFVYEGRENEEVFSKEDGITAYQTIESQLEYRNSKFDEFRSLIYTPSSLFGDEIEVWKFLVCR